MVIHFIEKLKKKITKFIRFLTLNISKDSNEKIIVYF